MPRLHPRSAVMSALRSGGQLAVFAVFASTAVAGMGGGGEVSPAVLVAAPAAFLVGIGVAVARWYRFEYDVLSEHLVVRSGVVARQEREIPLRRIQNVDVRRSVLQRALGLATVTVETAGGSATEATLDAVGVAEANRLREELGPRGRGARSSGRDEITTAAATATESGGATGEGMREEPADSVGPQRPERETLYELTGRRFAVLCAVSFRPSAVVAPFVGASLFDDVVFDGGQLLVRLGIVDVEFGPGDVPTPGTADVLPLVALAVVAFVLVVWVVSALLTFVRYYGFTLERVGDELRYERGLLGRYSGTVPLSKVQTVTVSENVAMRRLGYAGLTVDTAGAAPGSTDGDGGTETAVPLDTRDRVVALADDVRRELTDELPSRDEPDGIDDAFGTDRVERPPTRARRRYVVRYALASLAVVGLAVGVDRLALDLPRFLPWVPLIGVALAPLAGHLTWANRGHATVADGFVTRTGVLRRHTRLVPYFRLQTVFVSRSVFQRRRDLASVVGDSASSSQLLGGDATAHDTDAGEADALREDLLDRLRADLAARRRARLDRATGGEPVRYEGERSPAGGRSATGAGHDHGRDDGAGIGVRSFEWVDGSMSDGDRDRPTFDGETNREDAGGETDRGDVDSETNREDVDSETDRGDADGYREGSDGGPTDRGGDESDESR